jgi:hypothetical protein
MKKILSCVPYPNYSIYIEYDDGKKGVISLLDFLSWGIYTVIIDNGRFDRIHIIDGWLALARDEQRDIDAYSCYMMLD